MVSPKTGFERHPSEQPPEQKAPSAAGDAGQSGKERNGQSQRQNNAAGVGTRRETRDRNERQ